MTRRLTARQRTVLAFIEEYIEAAGEAPTFREIADYLGVRSLSTVAEHVAHLRAKGFLAPGRNEMRDLRPLSGHCPTCGQRLSA